MSEQPLENSFISLGEYEIILEPTPPNETPRQYVLRETGYDLLAPTPLLDREYTWEELRDAGIMPFIGRFVATYGYNRIRLRKRESSE